MIETNTLFALFFAGLGATVMALGAALVLGHKHKVNAHIGAVSGFVLLLLVTLYFAEKVGERFEFEQLPKRVHLTLAYLSTVFLVAPLASGVQHWRGKARRETHTRLVTVFLILAVATIATGMWMLNGRTPKATRELPAAGEALG